VRRDGRSATEMSRPVRATSLRRVLAVLAFVACLLFARSEPGRAQQALVLSGGGARGLAHVGVLFPLEELGYDPDIVIGNSMGAVVGALYAAGYDPEEIRARTLAIDWSRMFDPTPAVLGPDRALRMPMLTFGLELPQRSVSRGLFGEWRINRALVQLLFDANARAHGDFDRLARRYRAVAADLKTGEKVVLDSGDLPRAVRASMAYPGFFPPVQWGDRVLVDGGIVDNLPTIEARRLGMTHVIAVDVSRAPEEIRSRDALAVAGRSLDLMQQNLHPDTIPPDVLVLPITAELFIGPSFPDDPLPLIELGVKAARRDLPPPRTRRPVGVRRLPPAPTSFAALRIEAADSALVLFARKVFAAVAPGRYDPPAVLAAADRLYSTGLVEGVWPRVESAGDTAGGSTLVVRVDAPALLSLSLGAGYDNDRGGRGWLTLDRYVAVARRPIVLTAAVSTDGLRRWGALSGRVYSQSLPGVAWGGGGYLLETSVRSFTGDTRTTVEVLRAGGFLSIEFPRILRAYLITLTTHAESIHPEDTTAGRSGRSYGPIVRFASIPSEALVVGTPLLLEAEARWGRVRYQRVALGGSFPLALQSLQTAALVDVRAVSTHAPIDVQPALGDQHAVPGLRWGEGRGRARIVTGIDVAYPVPMNGFARLRLRTGAIAEEPDDWDAARWVSGAHIGGVWRIPLGSLEVGYGRATAGDGRFDFSIGRSF
jgi:predicted acylesterase/phospholipase RssA